MIPSPAPLHLPFVLCRAFCVTRFAVLPWFSDIVLPWNFFMSDTCSGTYVFSILIKPIILNRLECLKNPVENGLVL